MKRNKFKFSLLSSLLAFGVLGLAAGGLASCASEDITEETPDETDTPKEEVTYTLTASTTGLWYVGHELTVTATVNDEAISDFTVTVSSDGVASVEGNVITLTETGSLTIIVSATYQEQTLTDTIEGTVTADYCISRVAAASRVTIRGVVVAKNSSLTLIHDGESGVILLDNLSAIDIGDYLEVTSTRDTFSLLNGYILMPTTTYQKLEDELNFTIPDAVELTSANFPSLEGTLAPTSVIKYSWTAKITSSESSYAFTIDGITGATMQTPTGGYNNGLSIEANDGNDYDLEGYYVGYSDSIAYFLLTSASIAE